MKKLLLILLLGSFSLFVKAAPSHFGGHNPRSTVIVHRGYAHFYSQHYYYPYYPSIGFGLGFYYPFYAASPHYYHMSKLDKQIADIKHDYDEKIESAKMDKSLTGKERRETIRNLKNARDNDIDQAKRDYYKS